MNTQQILYVLLFCLCTIRLTFVFQKTSSSSSSGATFITDHFNPLTGTITTTTASGSFASNNLFSTANNNNKRKMNESDDEDDNYDM